MSIFTTTPMVFLGKEHIKGDVYTFSFRPARPVPHTAGQHGLLMLPGTWLIKPFSLASAPEDDAVMIATHVRAASSYKQALARLQPGDTVRLQGPAFRFVLEPQAKAVVFVAQGIGITPFRSLLRHIRQAKLKVRTTLIHTERAEPLFATETTALAGQAFYPASREALAAQLQQVIGEQPQATYYLSGSMAFVRATAKQLRAAGVARKHIKRDWFLGY